MLSKRLTLALTAITALLLVSCSVSRKATSSSEQLKVLSQESEQVRAESSELARDTLIEVTTVTVQLNEIGDTVKTSTVTDRTRARAFDRRKDVEVRTEIVRDTVYVERKDSVEVQKFQGTNGSLNPHPSALNYLKWIFALVCAIVVLVVVIRFGRRGLL